MITLDLVIINNNLFEIISIKIISNVYNKYNNFQFYTIDISKMK